MDFAYDGRTQEWRERLLAFMTEHVFPAEPVFAEQAAEASRSGFPGSGRPSSPNSRPRRAAGGCGTSSWPATPRAPG